VSGRKPYDVPQVPRDRLVLDEMLAAAFDAAIEGPQEDGMDWTFQMSYAQMAERTGLPYRTVRRRVAELEKRGLVERVRQGGRDTPSTYRLLVGYRGDGTDQVEWKI
jgi:DNA-binding transcriptional ArsR family regulator